MDSHTGEFRRKDWILFMKITGKQIVPPFLNVMVVNSIDKGVLQSQTHLQAG